MKIDLKQLMTLNSFLIISLPSRTLKCVDFKFYIDLLQICVKMKEMR